MTRGRIVAVVVLAAVVAGGGWWLFVRQRGGAALNVRAAHLAVRWSGKYRGSMALPARLNWCPGTRRGILEAISGDSGVAIVLYERDSLTSGSHAVGSPDSAASLATPGATVVMRWMRTDRDTAVTGFRSQRGTVRINLVGGQGSGDVNARMRSPSGLDSLVIEGVFRNVPVVTTAAACS